jgi:division protein CdvB (Snf7/Vps24/ESCRT-III family)
LRRARHRRAIIDAAQGARLETLAKRLDEIVARLDRVDARKPYGDRRDR